jgi:hypothetical protein
VARIEGPDGYTDAERALRDASYPRRAPRRVTWTQALKGVFALLALVCWFSSTGLFSYYDAHRPTAPNAAEGRIYPQYNHRSVVYLTNSERLSIDYLRLGAVVALVATALAATADGSWTTRRRRPGP